MLSTLFANGATDANGKSLIHAAANGDEQMVKTLIPVSNPTARKSQALMFSSYYGYHNCAAALFDVSQPKKAL